MTVVQLTLVKDAYKDPDKLHEAVELVRSVGGFLTLDARYASKVGLLTGELPEERIAMVVNLPIVSALARREEMRALT